MKKHLLLFLFCLISGLVIAQKTDIIVKNNFDLIPAYNVQVKDDEVIYYLKTTRNAPVQRIKKEELNRIEFANGRTIYFQLKAMEDTDNQFKITPIDMPSPPIKSTNQKRIYDQNFDRILTKENIVLEVEIIAVSNKEIKYRDANKKLKSIKRKDVVNFDRRAIVEETPQPAALPIEPVQQTIEKPPLKPISYRYTAFLIKAEGVYIAPWLSPQWGTDLVGLGMRYAVGGSLAYTNRFSKLFGFAASIGYQPWEVQRRYTENNVLAYSSTDKLQQIPLQIGIKVYVFKSLYFMPQATAQWFLLKSTTSETHPLPSFRDKQSTFYLGFGGDLGLEFKGKKVIADVSGGFMILPKKTSELVSFYALTNRLGYFGIRAGIGFVKYKNKK